MPKRPVRTPVPKRTQQAIVSALPWMLGMPGQLRLSAREQQPRPPAFIPPKGKKGGRGR
jgi:hypothetical protein